MNVASRTKLLAVMMLATLAVAGIALLSIADDSDQSDAATTDNLTYTVTGGCLTISGTGVMKDYTSSANLGTLYTFTTCVIESGVTTIGDYAFFGCSSLTSITIPDGVTSIGASAFRGCSSLTSITIPDSVTSIGAYTFRDCSSLTSITIPDGVTSIGTYAFYGCYSITSVIFSGSKPTLSTNTFALGTSTYSVSATIYSSGWASDSVFTSTVIGSYTTLTYSSQIKTVTFQPNNGDNSTIVVMSPDSVISNWPSDPVKTGYVFTGWYSDSNLTILFEISTPVTADITLYAGYEVSLVFQTEPSAVANVTASASFDNAISCSAASSTDYNSVIWDFGDGSTSTAIYCIHMYGESGTYTVTLTAVNDYGSDTTSEEVTVHTVGSNVDDTTTGSEPSFLGIVWYVWAIIAAVVAVIVLAKMGVMPL